MQDMSEMRVRSLGWEDPLEEGMYPLQYPCLENPTDRGAQQATVHGVAKSWTQLKQLSTHTQVLFQLLSHLPSPLKEQG